MDANSAALRAALHILLTLQQVGGYTYRNQRKFTEDIDWSYAGTLNQNNWAKKFPSCSNAKQSPINVEESLAQVKLQYQQLRLDGWENFTGQRTTIKNDGKTVALDVDGDFYVSGGGISSKFKVGRITFHWGRCNASSEGSEHSLDDVKYPLEMQIYCYEPHRFNSFHQTVKAGGRITALAVLFEASLGEDNSNFTTIIDAVNSVSRYGKSAQVAPFSPRALLPHSIDKYFIYNGSLTTPPCIETVEWIIFKNSVYISADQLEVFCEVMTMQQAGYVMLMDYLQNNYREQQHNYMGLVFSSYTGTEELLTPVCSSEPENMEATAYNLSSLLVTWERPRAVYDSTIEKYLVSYKMADAEDATPSKYLTDGDQDVGAILDDLMANYSYVIQVVAVCTNGLYGRTSNALTFTMPIEVPGNNLNPYSTEFEYEEENYPPDPSLNESVRTEDYEQSWIPTESPHYPPQHGVRATKTESTTIAPTSSLGTPWLPKVTTRISSTTPLYTNKRDHRGGIGPKSFSDAGLNMTTTTVSSSWMNGIKGVPRNGTTTAPTGNKTMTRPMTTTMKKTMIEALNRTTEMTANTTEKKSMTMPLDKTTTMSTKTASTTNPNAKKTETINSTNSIITNMTVALTKITATVIPPRNKSMTMTSPTTKTMNTTTSVITNMTANKSTTMTTPLNKTINMDNTIIMTLQMNKTTTMPRPTTGTMNKTTTINTTTAVITNTTTYKTTMITSPTNKNSSMNNIMTMSPPNNKTMTMIRPTTKTITKNTTMNKTLAVTTKMTANTTMTSPTNKIKNNIRQTNTTLNSSATTNKSMTTNFTHHSDQIMKPSSPYKDITTNATEDARRFHFDDGVRVQGEPSQESLPRGSTTPIIPHFSATKTSGWQSGVLLQTTPPLSKASTSEPTLSLPSGPTTPTSSEASNGISGSGSHIDQEWDRVQVSGSGEGTFPHSTNPPSTTLESGQTPEDMDDRSSAFYFDSESGSATGSGRAGAATPITTSVPSPTPLEESGSGHAENLFDNDTSSDFSIPEQTQQESEKEEEPMADVSNSSHESRVGSIRDGERKAVVPLAIISTLTALGLVVLIGILIYWRICFQTAHFYVDESTIPCVTAMPAFTSDEKAALPAKDFVKHVAELHQTSGFQRKFEEVQACTADMVMTSETSNHPDNKSKNRYSNIHAFDHSRVRLSAAADKDGRSRDYINANYVDGFKMHHAYIAAQGPLKSSMNDFWQMIWEQNVGVIVMITNLLEKGRRKCDQYWPAELHEDYGGLMVTLKSIQELAHYTQRTFTVTNTNIKKGSQKGCSIQRVVTQYHYTQWPDMGVPDHALPLISFIRKSSQARMANMGPVVVHCSAGVGRTGTYLVLDSMLRQMSQEEAVDVDGFLQHIRMQRNYLVQTQEQYVFIHDALVEAIMCGDTEVEASRLHAYVERLLTPLHDGRMPLHKQFKLLTAETPSVHDYTSALHSNNRLKNRSGSLLPVERSRVRLSPSAGDTSDYINASYVTGYRHIKEFIIAQNPLPNTIKDFWKMIWDHNVHIIVSLQGATLAQDADEEIVEEAKPCMFWPGKDSPLNLETLTVTQTGENVICLANEDVLVVHHLAVQAAQDDFVLEVQLYSAPRWPNPDSAISDTFLLVELLREETTSKEGPSVVLDRLGGIKAGTFCALLSLIGQLHGQRSVDVFQVAKMTNLSRPGTFCNTDQLEFLYEALLSVVDEQQKQEEEPRRRSSVSREHNGTPGSTGGRGVAESLESLV
ncbi:receptor-type tyrosine-protein phosphatase zeta-like isoform X2 [Corythoichthys intestinalis]|uniref:receptor-type tyrosine-protein phosphatase zeta-like isoform X2 n=1 Tax=Corythoichthys intestinalis TaxID=161448 RepID=UPI0025A664CE|nr:receptor-type tyrosine-protein phosphatase zeta-like isoform X2 [Corythoichthys intestinalis]